MKKRFVFGFVVLPLLGFVNVGCKPHAVSNPDNLQMITQNMGATRDNWNKGGCGSGSPETSSAAARARAYSALPAMLKKIFVPNDFRLGSAEAVKRKCGATFGSVRGNYPGANTAALSKWESTLEGCWLAETVIGLDGKQERRPVIYMTDKPSAIHNNMGALASYAFFEFFVDEFRNSASGLGASAEARDAAVAFDALARERAAIAETLVAELATTTKGRAALDNYKRTLVSVSQATAGYTMLATNRTFQNFVISEMADSYYCSPRTWGTFAIEGMLKTRARFDVFARSTFGLPWFAGSRP